MDFFQRQEIARRNTKLLEVYFVLAVIGIILTTYLAAVVFFGYFGHRFRIEQEPSLATLLWNPKLFFGVSVGTLAIIIGGSVFKTSQLASGGSAVAEMLGGVPINANTRDPDERKLLNVVEEMAIASGTPVPQVYVLPEEHGINAFAAGHSTSDMVVCATQGCLKYLTRDELQGVIGHEFSHILNGDMKLNLRLMGLVFGILCIAMMGRILLDTRSGNSRDRNALPLVGLALLIIGGLGVFFGKLIKSAVSRQREFLADASSVQFTRNPAGLASALQKVGGVGSRIADPNAEDASHFFFANGLRESFAGMFSTHPPIEDRIRALDPSWDGKFKSIDIQAVYDQEHGRQATQEPHATRAPQLEDLLGGRTIAPSAPIPFPAAVATGLFMQAGAPSAQHLSYAADWRSKLPETLSTAARDPMSAVALIYALLLSKDDAMRATQLDQLQTRVEPAICQEAARLFPAVNTLESAARLPLASLSMTALRQLSAAQYAQFTKALQFIIESDNQLELFEYTLQKIVLRQLAPTFRPSPRPITQYYVLKPILDDCSLLLSAMAYAGQEQPDQIASAFQKGAAKLGDPGVKLVGRENYALPKIDTALEHINRAAPQIKKLILLACAETVAADGVIRESEAELLRAVADTLDCPIPPFISLS
jgi:Zn-dependent protease with chaperone function/uncharacterized tellurite resistance protein B-like protein